MVILDLILIDYIVQIMALQNLSMQLVNRISIRLKLYSALLNNINIQNLAMNSQRDVFSTSFVLHNSAKGFFLHKIKKHQISSNFKFKSKVNSPKNSKNTILPYFRQEQVADQIHGYTKQKLKQAKNFRSLQLEAMNIQQRNQQIKDDANLRYEKQKVKIACKYLQPNFPEILNKKLKTHSKSNRITEEQQNSIDNLNSKILLDKNSRTIQNTCATKNGDDIEQLIKKQVLKTQNQIVLKKGQLKFDQKQSFQSTMHRKKFSSTKKRKKKNQIAIQIQSNMKQPSALQKAFALQGPEIKSFNLAPIKTPEQSFSLQKQKAKARTRYSFNKISEQKLKRLNRNPQFQQFKGWQNQNPSSKYELLQENFD